MTPEQKNVCAMVIYGNKTDPPMIYQQSISARMFVSYKLSENTRINFLKQAKVLDKVNVKNNRFYGTIVRVNEII